MHKAGKPSRKTQFIFISMLVGVLSAGLVRSASAGILTNQLVAKAQPDECFVGIGNTANQYPAGPTCTTGSPKVNQAYVWGLTEANSELWFGTAANVECFVLQS